MKTYIAILRGINVSGHKIIKMAELKEHLFLLGFANLTTYIQSGNIVFQSNIEDNAVLENKIHEAILEAYGFEVPVIVRSLMEWYMVVENFPFQKENELNRIAVTFLKQTPEHIPYNEIENLKAVNDKVEFANKEIYLLVPEGYGNTKLSNTTLEQKLKVDCTTRNWKTIRKLLELSQNLEK